MMIRPFAFARQTALLATGLLLSVSFYGMASPALAQGAGARPALVITNDPVPAEIKNSLYSKPVRVRDITTAEITGHNYYQPMDTMVARKINELSSELAVIQGNVATLAGNLNSLQRQNEAVAADYFSAVATINTQLQAGTTPGNPRLADRIRVAESSLARLGQSVNDMNNLAMNASDTATRTSFLLDQARAAYSLAGAVEEDHVRLAQFEDSLNNMMVSIDRVLNNINDDIGRTNNYLSSERNNLRTLALAVSNGDMYGVSLANRPFSNVPQFAGTNASYVPAATDSGAPIAAMPAALTSPRPLAKIRFDRPDVAYEQPVYAAINEALNRYPNAQFDLVAVHPSQGNAAEVAIESTRSRRNAERVLRSLVQMGLPAERINMSYDTRADATANEVHLYVR